MKQSRQLPNEKFFKYYADFLCKTCAGSGLMAERKSRRGRIADTPCRRCEGTGLVATGKGIEMLVEQIETLKGLGLDRVMEEQTHKTANGQEVTIRPSELGLDIFSRTGQFLYITAGNNHLTVAVRPRSEAREESWELAYHFKNKEGENESE